MSRVSLLKHTVDCWVSAAIVDAYPDAWIWVPTQRRPNNWDMAFEADTEKVFVLEDKAAYPDPDDTAVHAYWIDLDQLRGYVATYPVGRGCQQRPPEFWPCTFHSRMNLTVTGGSVTGEACVALESAYPCTPVHEPHHERRSPCVPAPSSRHPTPHLGALVIYCQSRGEQQ
jgi:hypothetical protein